MSEDKPMTVRDFIEKLKEFDQNLPVVFRKYQDYDSIEDAEWDIVVDEKICFINLY